jgi:Tfp pilus assembly protein PilF
VNGIVYITAVAGGTACPVPREIQKSQNRVDSARDMLSHNDDVGAESEIRRAEALDPQNEEAWNVHGLIYVVRARNDVTLADYQNCLTGADGDTLHKQADDEMHMAEKKFAKSVSLAPTYGTAWNNRAVTMMHFNEWDQAIDMEEKALGDGLARLGAADEPLARAHLGWAFFQKGDYVHAETELLQAMQRNDKFCLGAQRLGAVYFKQGKTQESADVLSIFENGKPCAPYATVDALYAAGQADVALKNYGGAKDWLSRCVTLAPKSCIAKQCETALQGLP